MYFLIPVALFALCLAHGIVRAVQDVRWERLPLAGDGWDSPLSDPLEDCMLALTCMGYSQREAEIFLETLTGKREYTIDLHFDLMTGKLRRSLEKKQ